MSYTALYRKFRPTVFEDVKGQEHIVTTLKNQIRSGRLNASTARNEIFSSSKFHLSVIYPHYWEDLEKVGFEIVNS